MRPPQNAGEDRGRRCGDGRRSAGFNEAPAERGGRLVAFTMGVLALGVASMRPPQNAGEDKLVDFTPDPGWS